MILFAAFAIVILMVATSLVGVLVGLRPRRSKGEDGELYVARDLRDLDPFAYRVFHDLYLPRPDGRGTTQVDHIVVSRFGIFVIETKNYAGWIFGGARQKMWTQSIFGRNTQFPNPLHQNHLHVLALQGFLGLPLRNFHSIVFFLDGDFRTEMPENVLCSDLCGWIGARQMPLMSEELLRDTVRKVEELVRVTNRGSAKVIHMEGLKAIHLPAEQPMVVQLHIAGNGQVVQPPPLPQSPWGPSQQRGELGLAVAERAPVSAG
ncbi:NERD domain-containing protein [Luteolibacter sp. GHJ8]|uniref:NERD domain-containing protein n=1 Tax=Luteolibacter rhizosphaerae TaxID=2989719 RepID=A0ABT3G3B5_9BACT|nr:nuclease-related domain-containing protein [Luteolibacter rhizosphaerae]MCW1913981.1 NERD domain-containing protein [Luteolibacter rhizosphaerae]